MPQNMVMEKTPATDIQAQLHNRLCEALEAIDAPLDLLQIVGSWGDTIPEEETLRQLEGFITRTTGQLPRADVESTSMTLEELDQRVKAPHRGDRD
jgi:hypothetical protein